MDLGRERVAGRVPGAGPSANVDAAAWHDATLQAPPVIASVAVAAIAALTAYELERSLEPPASPAPPPTSIDLEPGENAAWLGGISVKFGLFGWPRRHIPLEDVSSAESTAALLNDLSARRARTAGP